MSSPAFEASSIPLGSVSGIPIRLHVTYPLMLLLTVISQGFNSWIGLGWAVLLYGVILLITVLVHELGHSLATRQCGGEAHGILLWPLGGLAYVGHNAGPRADIWIALAGPLTHLPMVLLWLAVLFPVYHAAYGTWAIRLAIPDPTQHFGVAVAAGAVQLNIALALFNLFLPAYPLDGGRIFADALLLCGMAPDLAAKATAGVAVVLGGGVTVWGVLSAQPLTAFVGVWMLWSTLMLVKYIREERVQEHPLFAFQAGAGYTTSSGKGLAQAWGDDF